MSSSSPRRTLVRCALTLAITVTVAASCAAAFAQSGAASDKSEAAAASPSPERTSARRTWPDPEKSPAEILPLAWQSLLLDITQCAGHYLAVGARGDVLLSDDARAWKQAIVPTRSTLTAVFAVDAKAWAVGHDGVILHSADGGEHWVVQRSDPLAATPAGGDAARDPQQGAPLLDVLFLDTHRGFAVGAYSLALTTSDGGEHWLPMTVASKASTTSDKNAGAKKSATAAKGAGAKSAGAKNDDDIDDADDKTSGKQTFSADELKVGQEDSPHLNAITRTGSGALFIVGERGSAFRSRDGGATWQRTQLPYDGSMFGVLGYPGDTVLAFGLRGHVYESNDLGEHWTAISTSTELSLMGGATLPDGGAVIVGANGIVLSRNKAGTVLNSDVDQPAGIIASVLPIGNGTDLLLVGENGVSIFQRK